MNTNTPDVFIAGYSSVDLPAFTQLFGTIYSRQNHLSPEGYVVYSPVELNDESDLDSE